MEVSEPIMCGIAGAAGKDSETLVKKMPGAIKPI